MSCALRLRDIGRGMDHRCGGAAPAARVGWALTTREAAERSAGARGVEAAFEEALAQDGGQDLEADGADALQLPRIRVAREHHVGMAQNLVLGRGAPAAKLL